MQPEVHDLLLAELTSLVADALEIAQRIMQRPGQHSPSLSKQRRRAVGIGDEQCGRFAFGSVTLRQGVGNAEPGDPAENGVMAEPMVSADSAAPPANTSKARLPLQAMRLRV